MKRSLVFLLVILASGLQAQETIDQRQNAEIEGLKSEIGKLKSQLKNLKSTVNESKVGTQPQGEPPASSVVEQVAQGGPSIKVSGLVSVEVSSRKSYYNSYSDDVLVYGAGLTISGEPHPLARGEISWLWEEDTTNLEVDVATLGLGKPDEIYFKAGRMYLPFADLSTGFITDPLTLTLAEIRESALLLGYKFWGMTAELFAFRGDARKNNKGPRIRDLGATVFYEGQIGDFTFVPKVGYLKNMGDTGTVTTSLTDINGDNSKNDLGKYSKGFSGSLNMGFKGAGMLLGYIKSSSFRKEDLAFKDQGASPSAYNMEFRYDIPLNGFSIAPMVGHQRSQESVKLGMVKRRTLLGAKFLLPEAASITYEFNRAQDYGTSDCDLTGGTCGTGKKSQAHVAKLEVGF